MVNDLYNWFCANKLSLNANKTKYLIIRPPHRPCNLENYHIYTNNTRLSRVGNNLSESSTKFLGIYIDECLTWRYHVACVNSKISRAIFAIKQLKMVCLPELVFDCFVVDFFCENDKKQGCSLDKSASH